MQHTQANTSKIHKKPSSVPKFRRRDEIIVKSKKEKKTETKKQEPKKFDFKYADDRHSEHAKNIIKWIEDSEIRILTRDNRYTIIKLERFQKTALKRALVRIYTGAFKYRTIVFCWPRRHSKTIINALICLWRFFNQPNQNIKVVANSQRQSESTAYKLCKQMILQTPALLQAIGGAKNIKGNEIVHPTMNSTLTAINTNEASVYGEKVTVAWITELHAAQDDDVLQVLASSLGDTQNSLLLIDSTTDGVGGPLHRLELLWETKEDPSVFFHRRQYQDYDTAHRLSPPWIDRRWLKSRSVQMLPADFESQHLNKRGSGVNALFELSKIEACESDYPNSIKKEDIPALVGERKWIVGGGLDRAYGFTLKGDATIWTSIAKVAGDDGEAEYYVLNQQQIAFSQGRAIKKAIVKDHDKYGLENVVIEKFNAQDIHAWTVDNAICAELAHATPNEQQSVFTELHRIVAEGRLHYPKELEGLSSEMRSFRYDASTKSRTTFGHAPGFHDDRVYSLAWSIWALREVELVQFILPFIDCRSKSPNADLCYMRKGDAILHCSNECEAHKRVEQMFLYHRSRQVDREPSIPEFYRNKVRLAGPKIYQGI